MSVKSQQVTKDQTVERVQAAPAVMTRVRGFAGNHQMMKTQSRRDKEEKKNSQQQQDSVDNVGTSKSVPDQASALYVRRVIENKVAQGLFHSSGYPLGQESRSFMEARFGHDFSKVRIHTDGRAQDSAAALNARAYAVGRNIFFGPGEYTPETEEGKSLIAHELAHVIQQRNVTGTIQNKLRVGGPSDTADRGASAAADLVMKQPESSDEAIGAQIRRKLQASSLNELAIQRVPAPVKTWGGEYKLLKYEVEEDLSSVDGFWNVELSFSPNENVNAELIGMVQTARSINKHRVEMMPLQLDNEEEERYVRKSRMIKKGPGAGTTIDQSAEQVNPLYATREAKPNPKSSLSDTPVYKPKTSADDLGHHGWRYTDKQGTLQTRDALLIDCPSLDRSENSSQIFETTALAIKGEQAGTFYGTVQWGWRKEGVGKVKPLDLTQVSNDVPSPLFTKASKLWNRSRAASIVPSLERGRTINLPIATRKYTNAADVALVGSPSEKTAPVIKLDRNTRVEVIDKGGAQLFNLNDKMWKVAVVDGAHIGAVGWVPRKSLSDVKTE